MEKTKMDLINAIKEAYRFPMENKIFGIGISKDGKTVDSIHMWNLRNFTEMELIRILDTKYTYDLQNFSTITTKIINWRGSNCMDDITRMLGEGK